MAEQTAEWRPGSFTKNFSWGPARDGLTQLYDCIRIGFNEEVRDVTRESFRQRVAKTGRPDYIPINFFLFNTIVDGESFLVADELVFQAINFRHSSRFDMLALHAFNLSLAGRWKGASAYQRRPAEWARHYIIDRVAKSFKWDTSLINADDIEVFVSSDRRYQAESARKLSTNLNYLYRVGHLRDFNTTAVAHWWVDALFLTLDRVIEDRRAEHVDIREGHYEEYLQKANFATLTGPKSLEKNLATRHLVSLYVACGGRQRFSYEHVKERTRILVSDLGSYVANNPQPIGAIHPTNIRILKAIPRACAMLAKYVGFDTLELDELDDFDVAEFIKEHTRNALRNLRESKIAPSMSAEDLLKLTRGR